jgi:serine protease Do
MTVAARAVVDTALLRWFIALFALAAFLMLTAAAAQARSAPDGFADLAEQLLPGVVNISTTQNVEEESITGEEDLDQFFKDFFERQRRQNPQQRRMTSLGSGFVIDPTGYIVTNNHVIAEADEITVRFHDDTELKAKLVGSDDKTDLALLKVESTTPIASLSWGDSDGLRIGDWVLAIGNPFGLGGTVTAGIVSARNRILESGGPYDDYIQTDASINRGNSGGPLFNMAGEVVGINSQIYSRTGGYMGLSFSIPIDAAVKIKDDLVKFGKVNRGRIGVAIQGVNKDLAESFGLDKPRGALVSNVEPGSPADKAGLKSGDVVLAVDGKPVDQSVDLSRMVGETKPGTALTLQVWRKRATQDLRVTVGETPAEKMAAAAAGEEAKPAKLGVAVRPLSAEERKARGVDAGVVVERADGPAAKAGIREGDVILAFGGEKVENPEQLKKLVDKANGNVPVLVKRDDATIYVPVRIG